MSRTSLTANVGCGLNLDNAAPTLSVNQVLNGIGSTRISREEYLAETFNQMELLLSLFNSGQSEQILQMYYDLWLHSGQQVTIDTDGLKPEPGNEIPQVSESVEIIGLDKFGYLRVRDS